MNKIYRFNPDVRYSPKQYPGGIDLSTHMQIYVNDNEYVMLDFPDIFASYRVILGRDLWPMPNKLFYQLQSRPPKLEEYFGFYRCQLNFAIYCSTTGLGISKQHLMEGSPLLRSVYRFHVYCHIRRILSLLGSPILHEDGYKKWNNPFDANAYYKVCNLYGVNSDYVWMSGKWMYSTQGVFTHGGKEANKYTNFSNDYTRWIMSTSDGLSRIGVKKLSESVRAYAYCLLSAQSNARSSIVGGLDVQRFFFDTIRTVN